MKRTRKRKPPVLMSTLSESDRLRADRRLGMEIAKERERERETVTVDDNGVVVVLRRLVKGPVQTEADSHHSQGSERR